MKPQDREPKRSLGLREQSRFEKSDLLKRPDRAYPTRPRDYPTDAGFKHRRPFHPLL